MSYTFPVASTGVFPEMGALAAWVGETDKHVLACRITVVDARAPTRSLLGLSEKCRRLERGVRGITSERLSRPSRQTPPQAAAVREVVQARYADLQRSRLALETRLGLA